MPRRPFPLLVILLGVLLAAGCSDQGSDPADEGGPTDPPDDGVSFASDVQPIFDASCVGCHGPGGNAGLDLSAGASWANLVDVPSAETQLLRVHPSEPDSSWLYLKMTGAHDGVGSVMPPSGPLPTATLDLVRTWIEEGALDN
jgi:mono/diheme cytochrome c family protein